MMSPEFGATSLAHAPSPGPCATLAGLAAALLAASCAQSPADGEEHRAATRPALSRHDQVGGDRLRRGSVLKL